MLPDLILARAERARGRLSGRRAAPTRPTPSRPRARASRRASGSRRSRAPSSRGAGSASRGADGYTIEKGVFEAVPGLVVPAHVYRPAGPGPHPAVVHSLGPLDGERAARARHSALQRAAGAGRDARARLRPARAGRAAHRLASARPARPAARGLHVARRDGRRDARRARPAGRARGRRRRPPRPDGRLRRRLRLDVRRCRSTRASRPPRSAASSTPTSGQVRDAALRHRLGRLGRPLQPGAAPRGHGVDGNGARRGRSAPRHGRARDRRSAVPDRRRARRRGRGRAQSTRPWAPRGHARLVEVQRRARPARRRCATPRRSALAEALRPADPPAAEAPVELLEAAYAVTHEVARADVALAQTHVRAPGAAAGRVAARERRHERACSCGSRATAPRSCAQGRGADAGRRAGALRLQRRADRRARRRHEPRGARRTASAQRLDARRRAGRRRWTPCSLLPDRLGRRRSRRADRARRGRQGARARIGPAVARRASARLGGARPRPARHRRERGRASSSSRRPPGCSTATCSRPASTTPSPPCSGSRSATRRASSSTRAASRCWGSGAFGLVALLAAALDERIAGAASGPFAESLEELLVESPAITPMAFPFARPRDVGPGRPRAPRRAAAAARRRAPASDPAAGRGRSARRPSRRPRDPRARRRRLELRAGRRPAHRAPGRDRGRRRACWSSTRACRARPRAGAAAARGAARPARAGRAASRTPTATTSAGRPSCWREHPDARAARRRRRPRRSSAIPSAHDPRALRALRRADDIPFGGSGGRARARPRRPAVRRAPRRADGRRARPRRPHASSCSPTPGHSPGHVAAWVADARAPGRRRRGDGRRHPRRATARC